MPFETAAALRLKHIAPIQSRYTGIIYAAIPMSRNAAAQNVAPNLPQMFSPALCVDEMNGSK